MSAGPGHHLKRPWEIQSSSASSDPHLTSPQPNLSPPQYSQEPSGWRDPFDRRVSIGSIGPLVDTLAPSERNAKRLRTDGRPASLESLREPSGQPLSSGPPGIRESLQPFSDVGGRSSNVAAFHVPPSSSLSSHMSSPPGQGSHYRPPPPPAFPGPGLLSASGPAEPSGSHVLSGLSAPLDGSLHPATSLPGGGGVSARGLGPSLPPLATPPSSVVMSTASHPLHSEPLISPSIAQDAELKELQAAHSRLKVDYERTKVRLHTYERKSKTVDEELAMLYEEKLALQDRVALLEGEVDDVRKQKNEIQDLHTREGTQWRRIIALSDTLQKQHTDQADKWKEEKNELVSRIEFLEDQIRRMRITSAAGSTEDSSQLGPDDDSIVSYHDGVGSAFLTREVQRIRAQEETTKRRLKEYEQGNQQLKGLLKQLLNTAQGVMERMDTTDSDLDVP